MEIKIQQPLGEGIIKFWSITVSATLIPSNIFNGKIKIKKNFKNLVQEHSLKSLPFLEPSQHRAVKNKLQFWRNLNTVWILDNVEALVSILLDVIDKGNIVK